ncbi:MAG: peptide deformylase [Cyanobium sp.]
MAVCTVLRLGDPRLRQRARAVVDGHDPDLRQLITDVHDTMAACGGAGLAAPQIGVPLRVLLFGGGGPNPRYPDAPPLPRTLLINPERTPAGGRARRGLGGVPECAGATGTGVALAAVALPGDRWRGPARRSLRGWLPCWVVQHECDHLDGVLFPDRLSDPTAFGFIPELEAAGLIPAVPG